MMLTRTAAVFSSVDKDNSCILWCWQGKQLYLVMLAGTEAEFSDADKDSSYT